MLNFAKRYGIIALLTLTLNAASGQNFNDYAAVNSGNWNDLATWRQWNGTGWNATPSSFPSSTTSTVYILSGKTVILSGSGPYTCGNLYVETGARLYSNNASALVPFTVWGSDLVCDGEIGRPGSNDGIALNIEGPSCTIFGSGAISIARLLKSSAVNTTTNLNIYTDITLRWESINNSVFYNASGTASYFNVTLHSGRVMNCIGGTSNPGSVAIDGFKSASAGDAAGTFTINGTLIVAGILYVSNTNTLAGYNCNFIVGTGGVIKANQINSVSSNGVITNFTVQADGRLELTGAKAFASDSSLTWGTGNNRYSFLPGSTVVYSGGTDQKISVTSDFNSSTNPNNQYWNLILDGSGTKTIRPGTLNVRGNLTVAGSAVLDQEASDPDINVGGDWTVHAAGAFIESTDSTKSVCFNGAGTSPGTPLQTLSCPGGETFTNLRIAKATNASLRLLSPISVRKQLTLGAAGTSNYGILELNGRSLTIENAASTAIRTTGTPGIYRFIVSEDTTAAHPGEVRWHIGTSSSATPGASWPWPYVIPFGISTSHDTIPFGFSKSSTDDIGYLSAATYGTQEDNLPWPSGVSHLSSANYTNNTPDNRNWTADRYWWLGSTNPGAGIAAAFSYNRRNGTSSEAPLNDSLPANLKAQYWSAGRWMQPALGNAFGAGSTVGTTNLPVTGNYWTLTSSQSPLGNCFRGISYDTANAFCSYLWNGLIYTQSGTYSKTFASPGSCDSIAQLVLFIDTLHRVTGSMHPPNCFGQNNGSIAVTVTAQPTDSVTYAWSNGGTQALASNLSAGSYRVIVTDRNNCAAVRDFTVTQPALLQASLAPDGPWCQGDSSGTIQLTVSGGTPAYSFLWSDSSTQEDPAGLPPGTYSVTVTDANGCTATNTSAILSYPSVFITDFAPDSGNAGDTISIYGYGFSGATGVQFDNNSSLYQVLNDSTIIATVPPTSAQSIITVTGAFGCTAASSQQFSNLSGDATLTVRLFIEGFFFQGSMTTVLSNRGIGNSTSDVDTITAFLTDTTDGSILIAESHAVINTDGYATFRFPNQFIGKRYYLMVTNGNSVRTWSAAPITVSASGNYDFTDNSNKAYGNNMKQVAPGSWAIYTADLNRDDFIDTFDYAIFSAESSVFAAGYYQSDMNGDGFTDTFDYEVLQRNQLLFIATVIP